MFETDFVHNETEDNYDVEYVGTGVFGFEITEVLGTYVEGTLGSCGLTPMRSSLPFWA